MRRPAWTAWRQTVLSGIVLVLALTLSLATMTRTAAAIGEAPPKDPCAHLTKGSKKWKDCRQKAGLPSDKQNLDATYALGYALAQQGKYAMALKVLKPVESSNDPRVLTNIGFALRKLNRFDEALGYYKRSLAIDPRNVATLEYMGRAYLDMGDRQTARAYLARIAHVCGTCEASRSLSRALTGEDG